MEKQLNREFDSLLGGDVNIPNSVPIFEFGEHRINEILMLADAINEPPSKGMLFQRLPKHMRRRQMSHFDSRLPRRLRNNINPEGKDAPPKRPSRKYRRKPKNLLLEYNRRQRQKVWLETHIWHAKRFKMVEKWGYRLACRPTNKGFRANYRASAKHCLMIDLSYYNCIELIGDESILLSGLQTCTSSACGPTFAAVSTLDGSREGSLTLFHPTRYPNGAIGPVTFLWKPKEEDENCRQIWIWVHPAIHDEVVQCLNEVFQLAADTTRKECEMPSVDTKEKARFALKNVPFNRIPCYKSALVEMNLLKDTLNRYRLIGPLSSSVLFDALSPAPLPPDEPIIIPAKRLRIDDSVICLENDETIPEEDSWFFKTYSQEKWQSSWNRQKKVFEKFLKLVSPTQAPPHCVLSLLATDPRQNRPSKRTKSVPGNKGSDIIHINECDPILAKSTIWDSKIRDIVTTTKPSTWDLDQVRSERVVPSVLENGVPVPILLIQRPGCSGPNLSGYGSGWDVISPAAWGLPLWHNFVLRGARVGGLRETDSVALEGRSLFNSLPPDSEAGRKAADDFFMNNRNKYKDHPPAKRPNFNKMGIPSPFRPLWTLVMQQWLETPASTVVPEMFVVRDKHILRKLANAVDKCLPTELSIIPTEDYSYSLIPIAISCKTGSPTALAHIYMPTTDDLVNFHAGKPAPVEDKHVDENGPMRGELIKIHRKKVRSERRKRKKERKGFAEEIARQPLGDKIPEDFLPKLKRRSRRNEEWEDQLVDLWLPKVEEAKEIIKTVSRKPLGYALYGDFTFTNGGGTALGYVAFSSLAKLLSICNECKKSPVVLLRNTDQRQYRFGKINIVQE